jgi:hypothetical protein
MSASTHRSVVASLLARSPGHALCTKCIGAAVRLPITAVQRAAVMLEGMPGYRRTHTQCGQCGKRRLTIGAASAT